MSYRSIQVYYEHFARDDAGLAGLTSNNTVATANPLEFLIDDRQTTKMKFDSNAADHFIDMDMGAGFVGEPDTLIIPVGHSLDGIVCVLRGDTFHPPTTSRASFTPSGDGVIKRTVTGTGAALQYWRLEFSTLGAHELPGLVLTNVKSFTAGFNMPGALDSFQHNFTRFVQPSGISPTLQNGVRQRVINLPFDHALEGTDLATMEEWIEKVGMHRPFYIDPPSFSATPDVDDPATFFKFAEDPRSSWGTAVPNTETEKKFFVLNLIEDVG